MTLDDVDEAADFLRDLCTLGELRDMSPALGGRAAARRGPPLRRDLAANGRQHGHDHADRLVAPSRRGRLSRGCSSGSTSGAGPAPCPTRRAPSDEGPPPARGPEQGSAGRADARPAPRRRARLRGARPEPGRPGPERRSRHPLRAHERRRRVRPRRRRRPGRHRRRPARRDRLGPAGDPRARLRALPARGGRPVRTRRSTGSRSSPASASRRPTRTRPDASSPSAGSPST